MRGLAAVAVLAMSLTACGPKSMNARMRDSERAADKINHSLDLAEKAEGDLEPSDAQSNLDDAKKGLMDPDINLYPELEMMVDRYKELLARLDAVKQAREKKDLDDRLEKARDKVVPAVQKLSDALDKLSPFSPTKDQIGAIEDPAKDVRDGVDGAQDLFVKDPAFASWAKSQRAKAEKALDEVTRAKAKLRFIEGPGALLLDGQKKVREAKSLKPLDDKGARLQDAHDAFDKCVTQAPAAIADPLLKDAALKILPGKAQSPSVILTACKDALKSCDAELDKTKKAIAKAAKSKKKK